MNNERRFAVFQILSLQIYMECKDPRFPFTHPFYSNWKNKILISMIKFCNRTWRETEVPGTPFDLLWGLYLFIICHEFRMDSLISSMSARMFSVHAKRHSWRGRGFNEPFWWRDVIKNTTRRVAVRETMCGKIWLTSNLIYWKICDRKWCTKENKICLFSSVE